MEKLSAIRGCLDDAIALLDGEETSEPGGFVREAQGRLREAMTIVTALSEEGLIEAQNNPGALSDEPDVAHYLEGAYLSHPSEKMKNLFLNNTGREMEHVSVVTVRLASGRSLVLESPFRLVGNFLCGETPLEDQQCGLINLAQIETIEFSW